LNKRNVELKELLDFSKKVCCVDKVRARMSPTAFRGLKRKPENEQCIECTGILSVPAELLSMKCISVLLILCFTSQVCATFW
jgi:hypothetical protein